MGKPEAYVEDYLVKQCKKFDFLCLKFAPCGIRGVPDRIIIGNGQTVFVETKRTGGKLRELQEVIIQKMKDHGAIVYIANSREFVDELLNNMINNKKE